MSRKEKQFFFIEQEKLDQIEKIAKEHGMSVSAVIRLVIADWLDRGGKIEIKVN